MSIVGRVGALLRDELSARLGIRRWVARVWRPRRRERERTVGDDDRTRPAAAAPRARGAPARNPELTRYYSNLELPYGAGVGAVREARRRLLKRYHPDLHSSDPEKRRTATQLSQGLNRAHDELVNRLDRK